MSSPDRVGKSEKHQHYPSLIQTQTLNLAIQELRVRKWNIMSQLIYQMLRFGLKKLYVIFLKRNQFPIPRLTDWRSFSCAWMATTLCQNPRRLVCHYACFRLQTTSCKNGQKWGNLGWCTPVWARWCWPITVWTLWETLRKHCSASFPTCAASTLTTQVWKA